MDINKDIIKGTSQGRGNDTDKESREFLEKDLSWLERHEN
jgi:hypothetical protein